MENKLNVSCSPGTFHRVQNDENYMRHVTNQVLEEQGDQYTQIIYSETNAENIEELIEAAGEEKTEASEAIFTPLTTEDANKQYWSEGAVKLMLSAIEELQAKVGKSIVVKTKAKMYTIVSERMGLQNYNFTATQIENKFRGLDKQFKKTVLHNRQTGRNRQSCPFQKELEQVLGEKKGINPGFIRESAEASSRSGNESVHETSNTDVEVNADDAPSCSSQAPKRRRLGPRDELLQKLDSIYEQKEKFQAEVLNHMKNKEQNKLEMAKQK